jgi:hypothetical protein
MPKVSMLAHRLGLTTHCSPLEFKLKRLADQYAVPRHQLEEWLVDLANQPGLSTDLTELLRRSDFFPKPRFVAR